MIVCDTPEKITAFRLLALRSALGLDRHCSKGNNN